MRESRSNSIGTGDFIRNANRSNEREKGIFEEDYLKTSISEPYLSNEL